MYFTFNAEDGKGFTRMRKSICVVMTVLLLASLAASAFAAEVYDCPLTGFTFAAPDSFRDVVGRIPGASD